jgi:DNA mismatch endonuclease (patch repair protein)
MAAVKGSNTSLELTVDAAFRTRGWQYSRNVSSLPGKPDFVFERARLVVFVDGDFWHGWRYPAWRSKLSDYWQAKIERNRKRDQSNFRRLKRQGWRVLRIWEHDVARNLHVAVERVGAMLDASDHLSRKKQCIVAAG